jgi:hypothetical protein
VALLSGLPATAGTTADPDITDVAGDANALSVVANNQQDTRPVSSGNGDLRAVWFETAYSTTKVKDASGGVLRVEHRPTALLVRIRTEAPARPLTPWSALRFKVNANLPACNATLDLLVGSTVGNEQAEIRPSAPSTNCGEDASGNPITLVISPVKPTFDGAVSTLTYPLANALVSPVLTAGTLLSQTKAQALGTVGAPVTIDQTGAGRNFTIGQDVPADIDCTATPNNTECQS